MNLINKIFIAVISIVAIGLNSQGVYSIAGDGQSGPVGLTTFNSGIGGPTGTAGPGSALGSNGYNSDGFNDAPAARNIASTSEYTEESIDPIEGSSLFYQSGKGGIVSSGKSGNIAGEISDEYNSEYLTSNNSEYVTRTIASSYQPEHNVLGIALHSITRANGDVMSSVSNFKQSLLSVQGADTNSINDLMVHLTGSVKGNNMNKSKWLAAWNSYRNVVNSSSESYLANAPKSLKILRAYFEGAFKQNQSGLYKEIK